MNENGQKTINKEEKRKYLKKYREKNKEKILEKLRKYREKNRDFCRLVNCVSKFYNSKYFQYFSSIENYLTIMKLED